MKSGSFSNVVEFDTYITDLLQVVLQILPKLDKMSRQFCADLFKHESMIAEFKKSVDLMLCDAMNDCCYILADMLNSIRVDLSTFGFGDTFGAYFFSYPEAAVHLTMEDLTVSTGSNKFSFLSRP